MRAPSPILSVGWLSLITLVVVTAMSPAVLACPNCKLSVADQDAAVGTDGVTGATGDMAAGYAYSIYLMLLVPAVLLTGLVFLIRRQIRETVVTPTEA